MARCARRWGGIAAQVIMLGANLGTALTAWLVSGGDRMTAPVLILVAIVVTKFARWARMKGVARLLIGLGLMFLSLDLLREASTRLRASVRLAQIMALLGEAWGGQGWCCRH